jgi:serine/threonine protein kinase
MAYAEGPPATLVQPAEAAACVRHLAEALVSLHDRGWVHAALEPVQLRRTEAGLVVVGYGNLTPHGQRARRRGAGPYEAPEQAAGLPLDGRTDLYALGTLIHFWLTGEASGQLDLLDLVADPLAELGRWLLATRPGDRPADARTFLAALDRALPQGRRPLANTDTPRAPWIVAPPPANRSLAPFDALLTQLDGGQGAWRRLTSQPGAGKSAWLDRAAARARSAGWPVFRASGEGHWASPLAPWRVLWQAWQTLAEERQPGLVERFRYRLGSLADPP